MKFAAFTLSLFTAVAMAELAPGDFQAPGDDDIRSPCPAINTLANHGLINRDGRKVLVEDLAQALEDTYRVDANTLMGGPITSAIGLGLTTEEDGQFFLTIDRLFDGEGLSPGSGEAQEHDSSFVREDFSVADDGARPPSPDLIEAFFGMNNRAILTPEEVMEYQRGRIEQSCTTEPVRVYTGPHRGGMAIQGALLFVLAQPQGPTFDHIKKSTLRSILEDEMLPKNYDAGRENFLFTFGDGTASDDLRDKFRMNVEHAICEFCEPQCDFTFLE